MVELLNFEGVFESKELTIFEHISSENSKKMDNLVSERRLFKSFSLKNDLGNVVFYLLLSTIFLTAIPYGTVDLWFSSLFVVVICFIAVIRVFSFFFNGIPLFSNGTLIFPLAGLLGLAIIQITPFSMISYLEGKTISIDPASTKNFILIFSGLIITAEILLAYTITQKHLKALIGLVLAIGLGSAVFGIIREFAFDNSETGLPSYFSVGKGFAQYINRNHFLYLMEMSIGLLLGLILKGNLSEKHKFFCWVSSGFLILVSISANSRGGLISLTGIFILAAIIHFLTRNETKMEKANGNNGIGVSFIIRKAFLTTVLVCAVFGIMVVTIAFVGGDAVATRIESISGEVEQVDHQKINRLAIWQSTLELIKEKPLMGVGFGGYSAAITKFDSSSGKGTLLQAHNDYLELLANGGIISFLLVLTFGYIFIARSAKQFKSRDHLRRSSCFGAILGIIGISIHSLVDFGLHTMVNALLFVVLVVIATAKISRPEKTLKTFYK